MPVEGINGILNVENAALHASQVGIANTNPQHILSVGSNLFVSGDSSDVLTVDGNVVCEGVKVGLIEITPSYDFEAVTTVGNVTSNTLQFTNPTTGFVATGNVNIGSTLTVSGFRITAQAAAADDLEAITTTGENATRPANKTTKFIHITNATKSTTPYTGALQVGTIGSGGEGGLGVAGNVHVGGGVYVTSNLAVNTHDLFVDTTTSRVGIGKTNPATALDVVGTVTATIFAGELPAGQVTGTLATARIPNLDATKITSGTLPVTRGGTGVTGSTGTGNVVLSNTPAFLGDVTFDTTTLKIDSVNSRVGVGTATPSANLHVTGNAYVSSNLEVGTANLFVDTVNSRVGIGTTTPARPLEIAGGGGTAIINLKRTDTGTGQGGLAFLNNLSNVVASVTASRSGTEGGELIFRTVPDDTTQTSDNPYLIPESMRIDKNGNVGIGTANPSSQLELYGAGKDLTFKYDTGISRRTVGTRDAYYSGIENSIKRVGDRNTFDGSSFTPDTTHEILMGFSDTYTQYSSSGYYYPSYNEMCFKLWSPTSSTVGSLTDVLTLRGDGKVGIGTTDPSAILEISGPLEEGVPKLTLSDPNTNLTFRVGLKAGSSGYQTGWTTIDPNSGGGLAIYDVVYIAGTLSVTSTKNFLIDHPLQPTTKKLIHTAVESPRVDLIYRGTTQLKDGRAIVNIDRQCVGDESCAMEDGTFEALCRDPVYYLQNTTDFNRLIGTIDKNLLTIISEDVNSIAIVNWMVVAERKDRDIVEATQTNDNGRLNTEIIDTSERVNRDGSARYSSA